MFAPLSYQALRRHFRGASRRKSRASLLFRQHPQAWGNHRHKILSFKATVRAERQARSLHPGLPVAAAEADAHGRIGLCVSFRHKVYGGQVR